MSAEEFTRHAAELVAANDRAQRRAELRRRFRGLLAHAARRAGLMWSALALAAVILSFMPINVRGE